MLSLWILLLVTGALQARGQRGSPIVVEPSHEWSGNDGPWSSFPIRVGTPEQDVNVLVSTAVPETWIVLPGGCVAQDPSNCTNTRGGFFFPNQSSTWNESGLLDLSVEQNLGYTDSNNGDYGYDQLGLGSQGSGGPSLSHQVVAGIATKQYYLGNLGVNSKSINLTSFDESQPSLLSSLKNQGLIPSLSFGYTAGARYPPLQKTPIVDSTSDKSNERVLGNHLSLIGFNNKLTVMHTFSKTRTTRQHSLGASNLNPSPCSKPVFGSLTLGGYDALRFIPNGVDFLFAPDNSRDIVVAIQSINTTAISKPSRPLLSQPIYAYVDSTVPHIWLPLDACHAFESAFGIEWDPRTNLYLVNESLHNSLLNMNASVTFTLGNGLSGGVVTNINLPYAALDLEVSSPIVQNATRYFPLRRAENDTQYTLGRTILQEAYLVVDYERSNFSLSQCDFTENASQQIVAITIPNATSGTAPSTSSSQPTHGLSSAAIAGIVIAVVVVALMVAIAYYLLRRRQKQAAYESTETDELEDREETKDVDNNTDAGSQHVPELETEQLKIAQLRGSKVARPTELEGGIAAEEMGDGKTMVQEMPGHEIPLSELSGDVEPRGNVEGCRLHR